MIQGVKACLTCGKSLKGRSDKKYCDDYCRNNFNNQLNSPGNHFIRAVNSALRKNRRVLESFIQKEKTARAAREKLLQRGFQFKYHTHTYTNKKGNVYHFCYEYGYLALENDWYLVVKRREG
jgi:hypothetical protein